MASWYCNKTHLSEARESRCYYNKPDVAGDQLYAAIRRGLLGHRGDYARVCLASNTKRCVTVLVIDCNCAIGANIIDLYSDAFRQLAPLGRGRIDIKLTWL